MRSTIRMRVEGASLPKIMGLVHLLGYAALLAGCTAVADRKADTSPTGSPLVGADGFLADPVYLAHSDRLLEVAKTDRTLVIGGTKTTEYLDCVALKSERNPSFICSGTLVAKN